MGGQVGRCGVRQQKKGECRLSRECVEKTTSTTVLPKRTHMTERLPRRVRGHPRLPPLLHQSPAGRARADAQPELVDLQ